MATHFRVLIVVLNWVVSALACIIFYFLEGMLQTYFFDKIVALFTVSPALVDAFNNVSWIPTFIFAAILIYFIVSTIYMYYTLVERNDYFPDQGVY